MSSDEDTAVLKQLKAVNESVFSSSSFFPLDISTWQNILTRRGSTGVANNSNDGCSPLRRARCPGCVCLLTNMENVDGVEPLLLLIGSASLVPALTSSNVGCEEV